MNKAFTLMTTEGKDIIWKLNGYKNFLKWLNNAECSTNFSWYATFDLIKRRHWDSFIQKHSSNIPIDPLC
jgi:hypothetical protein